MIFAKYIPLLRRVRVGDYVGGDYYVDTIDSNTARIYDKVRYDKERVYLDDFVPVEELMAFALYLVTNDIVTGDEIEALDKGEFFRGRVVAIGPPNPILIEFVGKDGIHHVKPLSICYKIVGGISGGAEWVKEGDVFTPDEIRSSVRLMILSYDKLEPQDWRLSTFQIKNRLTQKWY